MKKTIAFFLFSVLSIPVFADPFSNGTGFQGSQLIVKRTDCSGVTQEGRLCWDTDNDILYGGTGALAVAIDEPSAAGSVSAGIGGFFSYYPANGTTVDDSTILNTDATNIGIGTATPGAKLDVTGTIRGSSTITSSAASTIGWSVVAGANTACTTTCTSACVFGFDTALGGTDLVDCADATADRCVCAGNS